MDYKSTIIYKTLKDKIDKMQIVQYLSAIEKSCDAAVAIATHIVRIFPMFTLHNEIHFVNVLEIIAKLVGKNNLEKLTIEELSMLLLCSCCHDLGMSVPPIEKKRLTCANPVDKLWKEYFALHLEEKKNYNELRGQKKKEEFLASHLSNLIRDFHHERIYNVKKYIPWDNILLDPPIIDMTPLTIDDLCLICKSHGQFLECIDSKLESITKERLDLRMCAVLLRLGDILDFDATRAPKALYNYLELTNPTSKDEEISKTEWDKHLTNGKFVITDSKNKLGAYVLPYRAECNDLDVYEGINRYIDWVDYEFECSNKMCELFDGHLSGITFPYRVDRKIKLTSNFIQQTQIQPLVEKCTNWLFEMPVHWGAQNKSKDMQNANTCESLIALQSLGYNKKMEKQYNQALQNLLSNVTDRGVPSKSLNAETIVCTSMLLYLMHNEKNNKLVDDFSKFTKLAEVLWSNRNSKFGWGVYVSKAIDEDCICANTYWALRALIHYDIGRTREFKQYVVQIYQNARGSKWGYVYGDEPKIITTAMYLGLYYELDHSIRKALDKCFNRKIAIDYVYQAFADQGIQLEVETLNGIEKAGDNSVKKVPWNHILIGYVLEAISKAYDNGDIGLELLVKIHLRLNKIIKNNVHAYNENAYYYMPDNMVECGNCIYTYPTMHFLYGISKFRFKEEVRQ